MLEKCGQCASFCWRQTPDNQMAEHDSDLASLQNLKPNQRQIWGCLFQWLKLHCEPHFLFMGHMAKRYTWSKAVDPDKSCTWISIVLNWYCVVLNIFWQLHFVESEYICHKTPWLLLWNWKLVSVGLLVAPDIQHEFACHALKYNLGLMCGLNMNNWLPRWMKE